MPIVQQVLCPDHPNCSVCNPDFVGEGRYTLTEEQRAEFRRRLQRQQRAAARRARAELRRNNDTLDEPTGKPEVCDKGKDGQPCVVCSGGSIQGQPVLQYSYKPDKYKFNKVRNDKFDYFLGVELETDNNAMQVNNDTGAGMARPVEFWVPKHDSSVTGPEFTSHPATLTWWRKNIPNLEEMFGMLLHAGFSSHNGNHCGMHVNISRNAFIDGNHLYRFMSLLHNSPTWAIAMSQRTVKSAQQWARIGTMDRRTRRLHAMTDRTTEHTAALGIPEDHRRGGEPYYDAAGRMRYRPYVTDRKQMRYEFRLPRGTLRVDRFMKNLEWTVAMIEFTRTATVKSSTSVQFTRFVFENEKDYPYLVAYIREKFAGKKKHGEPVATV